MASAGLLRQPTPPTGTYLPTLDGWRAIAILLVLISHYASFVPSMPPWVGGLGGTGVSIFFGMSGLLIATLLLRERESTGQIDLRSFYVRRCFRILPVAWLFLAVVFAVRPVAAVSATNAELWSAASFLRNYVGSPGGTTQHFWSLAIEEHFYLIFPVFLALRGARATRMFCISVAVVVLIWRGYSGSHITADPLSAFYRTDVRIDALFDGALAAILWQEGRWPGRDQLRRFGGWQMLACGLVGLACSRFIPYGTVARSLVAVSIPVMLLAGVLFPELLFARMLEVQWLRWIGRVSYSLYLWQGLFTGNMDHLLWGRRLWPLNLVALFVTAVASYYLLERPMIRVGFRMLHTAVNNSRNRAPVV